MLEMDIPLEKKKNQPIELSQTNWKNITKTPNAFFNSGRPSHDIILNNRSE